MHRLFYSKMFFTSRSEWVSKDTFLLENAINCHGIKISFMTESTIDLKIEVSSLQQSQKN